MSQKPQLYTQISHQIGNLMDQEIGKSSVMKLTKSQNPVEDLTGKVHQLPCCIKLNGSCTVSHYFKPKSTGVEVDGLSVEEAYFRGRKLQGTTVSIPKGYCGYVLGKKNDDKRTNQLDDSSSWWEMNAVFNNLTLWNHDILPSKDDAFLRAFHWFPVADALHNSVSIEDLESASTDGTLV